MRARVFRYFLFLAALTTYPAMASLCCQGPSYCWTGLYAGLHGGYGWSSCSTSFDPLPNAASFVNLRPTNIHIHPSGGFGGGQVGYNLQCKCFVFGFETDISGSNFRDKKTVSPIIQNNGTPFPGAGFLTTQQRTDWFGTFRPRIGYSLSRCLLIYGTGGLAYGHTRYKANTNFKPVGTIQYPVSFSKVKTGWTAGGGLEYAFCGKWSLQAQYLYYDLGSISKTVDGQPAVPPFQVKYDFETRNNIVCIGLNYRFGCSSKIF